MTLRKKTLLIIGATFIGLIIVLFFYSQIFLLGRFTDLEKQDMKKNVERGLNALFAKISVLNTMVCDYAWWDDTCNFLETGNTAYIESNFSVQSFPKTMLNFVIICDTDGKVLFKRAYDLINDREAPVPAELHAHIDTILGRLKEAGNSVSGILNLDNIPAIIAARPILTSIGEGPIRGAMIMGRYLDESTVRRLSIETSLNISLMSVADPNLPEDLVKIRPTLFLTEASQVSPINDKIIGGYIMLRDIYDFPVMLLRVTSPRAVYQKGFASIKFFLTAFFFIGFIVLLVVLWFIERIVLSPLAGLSRNVNQIGSSGDLSARMPVLGDDELSSLGCSINGMLENLQKFQESETRYVHLVNQLQTAHRQLQVIIELLPDATFVIDSEKRVIAWNNAMEEMTNIKKEEVLGKGGYIYAIPFYGEARPTLIDLVGVVESEYQECYQYLRCKGNTLTAEVYVPALMDGKGAYLMVTASPLFDSIGNMVGAIESIRDITERKRAEELQKYLSLHDALTGLYNRTYFEQMMIQYEKKGCYPVGIILCDVDGLKIANDTMGHDIGDKLLSVAAEVIRTPLSDGEVVARIGGDEFAILLPAKNIERIEELVGRIRVTEVEYNSTHPSLPLSISIGYAIGDQNSNLREIFKEADNNMYREKLLHRKSNHSTTVQALLQALEARDFIFADHIESLQELVARIEAAISQSHS